MKSLSQLDTAAILDILKKVDKKTWVKIGAATAGGLILFVFIVWPAWFQRIQVHNQIRSVEEQILTLQTQNHKKPQWLRDQADYKKFIEDAKGRLFKASEVSLLLGAISKLADESKTAIVASRPKDLTEKLPPPFDERYEGGLYDFTLEGNYHAVGNFVSKVESYPKLLRVQLCHITAREEHPETHLIELSLSAVSFKKGKA